MNLADFSTPNFYADPYPVYDRLRDAGPVVQVGDGLWATASYEVTNTLLCDRRMGRNHIASIVARYGAEKAQAPVFQALGRIMLFLNPPTHTRLRALTMKVFTAAQVTQTKVFAEEIAARLIDAMARAESTDLMSDFAMPLPAMVICSLLGVPVTDSGLFTEAVAAAALSVETAPLTDRQIADANRAIDFMQAYFRELLAARRLLGDLIGSADPELSAAMATQGPLPSDPEADAPSLDEQLATAEREAARARIRVAQASAVPDITGSGGIRRINDGRETAFVAGVSLPLPIRDRNRGGIAAAQADELAADANLSLVRLDARRARHDARMLLGAADERVAVLSGPALKQAEEAVRLARIGYAAGKFSLVELLDTQAALTSARTNLIEARLDRARALAALIRAQAQ